ncbi:MAG TPA: hypothetical protein VF163_06970, partial [Micromonosporaceae bacterium]
DLGDAWLTPEASVAQVAVGTEAVAIGTAVNVFVQVSVDLLDSAPAGDADEFDHVAELSLHCGSGRLVMMGCTDYEPDAQRVAVPAGWLRIRAARGNLDRAYRADLASDESAETIERVRLQIWPAPRAGTVLLKQWSPPAA